MKLTKIWGGVLIAVAMTLALASCGNVDTDPLAGNTYVDDNGFEITVGTDGTWNVNLDEEDGVTIKGTYSLVSVTSALFITPTIEIPYEDGDDEDAKKEKDERKDTLALWFGTTGTYKKDGSSFTITDSKTSKDADPEPVTFTLKTE